MNLSLLLPFFVFFLTWHFGAHACGTVVEETNGQTRSSIERPERAPKNIFSQSPSKNSFLINEFLGLWSEFFFAQSPAISAQEKYQIMTKKIIESNEWIEKKKSDGVDNDAILFIDCAVHDLSGMGVIKMDGETMDEELYPTFVEVGITTLNSLTPQAENRDFLQKKAFSLRHLVDYMTKPFIKEGIRKEVKFVSVVPPDVRLMGDFGQLSRVIRNFLSNALKFTPAGGEIRLIVEAVKISYPKIKVTVRVIDSGPGISSENLLKLAEPRVQIDPGKLQGGKGQGLGLYNARKIIEAHGGTFIKKSELGRGSEFGFEINFDAAPLS